jgi:hypothetical protein
VGQRHFRATSADLAERKLAVPRVANREAGGGVLPEQFAKADRDEDLPDVREVSCGVEGDAEGGMYLEGPGGGEGVKFRGEDGGGQLRDDGLRQESKGLVVKDWSRVDPVSEEGCGQDVQGGCVGGKGCFGKGVNSDVHGIVGVGTRPGETQGVRVCMDEVEYGLEELEVGGRGGGC